jgi:mannose-6-phosphate isomerase-like protein (cupin superfamily)
VNPNSIPAAAFAAAAADGDPLVRVGHLREPEASVRPSGALLTIFDLPQVTAPVAPFTLARFVVPAGLSSSPDTHDVRELWVILSGEGLLLLDGDESRVGAGDVLYFESRETHQLVNDGQEPVELVSMWWRP